MKKIVLALIATLTLCLAPVHAADFQKGLDALDNGDYAAALIEFKSLAEQGHAKAQYNLGRMYRGGKGVVQYDKEAVKLYRLAAEQGLAEAQFNLGRMYGNGEGVVQDDKEAVKWFRLAAEQGYATAQSRLGVMYGIGQGVVQDKVRAHMWFNISSASGDDVADTLRDFTAYEMTSEDISKAQSMAKECMDSNYKNCGY